MGGAAVGAKVAVLVGGGSRLRSFDISEGLASGEYLAHLDNGAPLTVYEAVVISKGQEVLAIGTSNQSEAWFVIGDLNTGETLLQHQLTYAQGQIAVNESETVAAVSDPSKQGIWDSYPTIDLFDLTQLTHVKRFESRDGGELEGIPGNLCFIPGSHSLVAANQPGSASSGSIHLIDVNSLRVTLIADPPFSSGVPTTLVVGLK
jgi:hypothetical protein